MPCYKLFYFNLRGYAEMIRLIFAEAGVEYEDVRYTHQQWPNHKQEMLFGQMPVLMVDGEQIAHSRAAVRYLAREFKLDGGSALNAAKMDMWIEVFFEAFSKLPLWEKDKEKQKKLFPSAFTDYVLPKLFQLETQIIARKGAFIFGEEPSALDFVMQSTLELIQLVCEDQFLEALPNIKNMMSALVARPRIAKWMAERPETEH